MSSPSRASSRPCHAPGTLQPIRRARRSVRRRAHVLLYDQVTRRTRLVPAGLGGQHPNAGSYSPTIDASGHQIAYSSDASNLVLADTNQTSDAFVTTLHR